LAILLTDAYGLDCGHRGLNPVPVSWGVGYPQHTALSAHPSNPSLTSDLQVVITAPSDLVKVRLQGQASGQRYRGPLHCVSVILREEGPRGLFRGGLALALRDIPCYGLYFLPYELVRRALTQPGTQPGEGRAFRTRKPLKSSQIKRFLYAVLPVLQYRGGETLAQEQDIANKT